MMRFEQRTPPVALAIAAPVIAAAIVVVLVPLGLALLGRAVPSALAVMFDAAVGSTQALGITLARTPPLILTGLATLLAFRVRLMNFGAEGQLLAGALAAIALGTLLPRIPAPLLLPLAVVLGALAGALMMALPAIMKMKLETDEAVVTLILNVVALIGITIVTGASFAGMPATGVHQSLPLTGLPFSEHSAGARMIGGFVISGFACVAAFFVFRYTTMGFAARAAGANPDAAVFAGIPVARIVLVMGIVTGALAGFAGAGLVTGLIGASSGGLSTGLGYAGIAVALLAGRSPLAIVPAALFVSTLIGGAEALGRTAGAPTPLADAAIALTIMIAPATALIMRFRPRRLRVPQTPAPAPVAPKEPE